MGTRLVEHGGLHVAVLVHKEGLDRLGDGAPGDDGVLHLGRLGREVRRDVLTLESLSHGSRGSGLDAKLGLDVGALSGLIGGELASLGGLLGVVAGDFTVLEGLLGEVGSVLLLGLDAESLALGLALGCELLVGELGGLLHGDLLLALHGSLLVSVVVLASVVEGSLDELEHTVGGVEGLTGTVVNLVLANQLAAIGLEAVGGDDVLL